jgi:hypothetical protein
MPKQVIFLSLCALLVSGCGSPYVLNIDTVPTGATIWQAGATSSYTTPVELAPDPNFRHPTTKCILVTKVHAKWQSGATVTSQDPIQLCGEFDTWTLTLERPSGYPGLQTDLMVEQRILLERQLKAERGAAAMAAGFESLGRGLGCLAGGGRCSSSDTSYSYSTPARATKTILTYQGESKSGDDPPVPDLDLDLDLVLPGEEPTRNRCPITSPYYLTPSCLGE